MHTKNKIVIVIILLIACVLRLYNISSNPPHLTPDEAALGYNAYSILKTGRDEYGTLLPIIFKSFGDYKPGLYIYLTVPFVASLGLNEFAVRLTSALAGIFAVWLIYKITEKLFPEKKYISVLSAFFLAISPWHVHLSRGAWEVNLALTLTLAGILGFLLALKKPVWIITSALFFGLTLITYQGAKLSTLVVFICLAIAYFNQIKQWFTDNKAQRSIVIALVLGLVISLPILFSLFQGKAGRLKVFSVFSYKRPAEYLSKQLELGQTDFGSVEYYLFYSESLNMLRGVMGRWFNHFSGRFLFFEGDWQNPRHSAPNHGMLLLADMIFLTMGLIILVRNKSGAARFILLWLILAPLPAVLSRDQVQAVRALNIVIPITITIAAGMDSTIVWLKEKKLLGKLGILTISGMYMASFIYFLDAYFIHQPVHNASYWKYGFKQIAEFVYPQADKYSTVYVEQSYDQPYIYFLFYSRYDPARYQAQAKIKDSEYGDVGLVYGYDNYCFCDLDWNQIKNDPGSLVVASALNIPKDQIDPEKQKLIKEIYYPDKINVAFRVVENLKVKN